MADELVQSYLEKFATSGQWHIGLIIGQMTSQKDYILHMAETPDPVEDEVSDVEQEVPASKKSTVKPGTLEEMNNQWLATHAKQVTRMLPGGLDVIGIFVIAPLQMIDNVQSKIIQMLFAIQKLLLKCQLVTINNSTINNRIILQMCPVAKKYTCRIIDVSDIKSLPRQADFKFQNILDNWIKLEASIAIDLPISVTKIMQNCSFNKKILAGIEPFCASIWNGMATIGGHLRKPDESINPFSIFDGKKSKNKSRETNILHTYTVDLLIPHDNMPLSVIVNECSSSLWIRGVMSTYAYVYPKATVKEGVQAIKCDVIRSLISRCELLCEDINVIEEDAATKTVFDTPIRVFGSLPKSILQFCDYMFQDEELEETISRFKELLDITITEECLRLQCERTPVEDDIERPKRGAVVSPDSQILGYTSKTNIGRYYLGAVAGAIIAAVASISFFFFDEIGT